MYSYSMETKIEKELKETQKELFEIAGACTVFLNKNGLPFDVIEKMLIETVKDAFTQVKGVLQNE